MPNRPVGGPVTKVFISFDYDHDKDLTGNLVAQAKLPDSPFKIVDQSLSSAVHDGNWKRQVRDRIRRADVVVFICGVNTHSAKGVEAEMSITQREGKRYFLLKGRQHQSCSKPKNAPGRDGMQPWTWANPKNQLQKP